MHCLAPNSSGDGTGCDNMTCIIITFKPYKVNIPVKPTAPSKIDNQIESQTSKTDEEKSNAKRALTDESNADLADKNENDEKSCKKIKISDEAQENQVTVIQQDPSIKTQ
jgi:hypothetical protein